MRDPVKTTPPDPVRDPMRNRGRGSGAGRWIWVGALVLLALVLAFWFAGMTDDTADIDATPAVTLPAEEAIVDPETEVIQIQPETDPETGTEAAPETGVPSTPPQ